MKTYYYTPTITENGFLWELRGEVRPELRPSRVFRTEKTPPQSIPEEQWDEVYAAHR